MVVPSPSQTASVLFSGTTGHWTCIPSVVRLKFLQPSIVTLQLACVATQRTARFFGRTTAVNVKLLLPPRQSRGASFGRLAKITKLPRATARATQKAAVRRLQPIGDFVHTITFDNGKEFATHQDIAHEWHVDVGLH